MGKNLAHLVWIFCLAGTVSALQFPLQYHYHYRARLLSSIPEINNEQVAASDFRADLKIYTQADFSFILKLENVEVADYHGTVTECESENELPLEYRTLLYDEPGYLIGQNHFIINEQGLTFHEDDPEWVRNFYKSIASYFGLQTFRSVNLGMNSSYGTEKGSYRTREQTVMGNCDLTYTQHELTGVALNEYKQFSESHIVEDVQLDQKESDNSKTGRKTTGRKTGRKGVKVPPNQNYQTQTQIPTINSTMWQVIRSLNLEDCDKRVEHQHALSGVYCDLAKDQCKNLVSRNSHGVFFIRGDSSGVRLEKAVVRGALLVSPFGFQSEKLTSNSIQSISLVSVKTPPRNLPTTDFPQSQERSLLYRMILPYSQGNQNEDAWSKFGSMRQVMELCTAYKITSEIQEENEERVLKLIKQAFDVIQRGGQKTGPNEAPALLNYATILLYDFNKEQMERVVQKAFSDFQIAELDLLGGVLAEVGSVPAIEILISLFKENKISSVREAFMFGTLQKNIKSAEPLKLLLNYLDSSSLDATPFKTSHSLVNFASLVNTLCVKYPTATTFSEIAHYYCENDEIVLKLENMIRQSLETADSFWKRMVLIKSLVNLKTIAAFNILKPYILGQKNVDTMVRITAMQSLMRWNTPRELSNEEATLMLLEIFENPTEKARIRAKSLSFLVSWDLSSTMWSRLAFTTKRPLLKDLAAFTYSVIEATANFKHPEAMKQSLYAGHALLLTRKFTPIERYSSFRTWYEFSFDTKIGTLNHMDKIVDPLSPLPSDISIYLRRALGGAIMFKKFDGNIANQWGDLEVIALELFRDMTFLGQYLGNDGGWDRFLQMLTSGLDISERVREPIRGLLDIIPINAMEFFIPLQNAFLLDTLQNFITLLDPSKHNVLYYNSIDSTFFTVNDLGLPIILSTAKPKIWYFKGQLVAYQSTNAEYKAHCIDCLFSYASTIRTHLEAMALWSGMKVAAGVSQTVTINEPLNLDAHYIQTEYRHNKSPSGLRISFAPSSFAYGGKTSLLNIINIPYTILRNTKPADVEDVQPNMKIVLSEKYNMQQIPLPYGLLLTHATDSTNSVMSFLSGTTNEDALVTTRHWKVDLQMNFEGLHNKTATFNLTRAYLSRDPNTVKFVSKYGQDSYSEDELCGAVKDDFTQQTGQTADYYDYFQQSSSTQDIEEFGFGLEQSVQSSQRLTIEEESDVEVARASYGAPDAATPILDYYLPLLRREKGWIEKIWGYSARFSISDDTLQEKDEALEIAFMTTFCDKVKDKRDIKFLVVFGSSRSPCDTMCMDLEMSHPKFTDLDTVDSLTQKDLTKFTTMKTYLGEKCKYGPFLDVNETRILREEDLQNLVNSAGDCNAMSNDPIDEFAVNAMYSKIDINILHKKDAEQPSCKPTYLPIAEKLYTMINGNGYKQSNLDQCLLTSGNFVGQRITAERLFGSEFKGSMDLKMPDGQEIKLPMLLTAPTMVENVVSYLSNNFLTDYEMADYCVINETSLTTFDGLQTSIEFDSCPVLAVTNCEAFSNDKFALGVSTSRNGGLAVNIVSRYLESIITMDEQGVEVNGERMADQDYHKEFSNQNNLGAVNVYKRNGFYKVEVGRQLSVILKEGGIYIKTGARYNGYLCGLCGNHDREPINDMKQPNGCLLTDAEMFKKSWVPSSSFQCFSSTEQSSETCIKENPLLY